MAVYLIDYENVYTDGLDGIEKLTKEDFLYLFYSQNRYNVTFDYLKKIESCQAQIQLIEVNTGNKNATIKNALDIQLMMFAGYVIGIQQSKQFYIISKDNDFKLGIDFFQKHLHQKGMLLQVHPKIKTTFSGQPERISKLEKQVRQIFGENTNSKTIEHICTAISQSTNLIEMHNYFVKIYHDSDKVSELYQKCKPHFETLRKLANTHSSAQPEISYQEQMRQILEQAEEQDINILCQMIAQSKDLNEFHQTLTKFYTDKEKVKNFYQKCKPKFSEFHQLAKTDQKFLNQQKTVSVYYERMKWFLGEETNASDVETICQMLTQSKTTEEFHAVLVSFYADKPKAEAFYSKCEKKFEEFQQIAEHDQIFQTKQKTISRYQNAVKWTLGEETDENLVGIFCEYIQQCEYPLQVYTNLLNYNNSLYYSGSSCYELSYIREVYNKIVPDFAYFRQLASEENQTE